MRRLLALILAGILILNNSSSALAAELPEAVVEEILDEDKEPANAEIDDASEDDEQSVAEITEVSSEDITEMSVIQHEELASIIHEEEKDILSSDVDADILNLAEEFDVPRAMPSFDDNEPAISIHDANEGIFYPDSESGGISAAEAGHVSKYKNIQGQTSVKNQGSTGICWAFAGVSAVETSILAHNQASSVDLSERQLAYFLYHPADDALGNISGDSTIPTGQEYGKEYAGDDKYLFVGAAPAHVLLSLASWKGVTDETQASTDALVNGLAAIKEQELQKDDAVMNAFYAETALADNLAYEADTWHLTDAYQIKMSDQNDVKKAIMDHGSVMASIWFPSYKYGYYSEDNSGIMNYYNNETNALRNLGRTNTTHIVTLVGWDDNYPRKNFSNQYYRSLFEDTVLPTADGAWLAKNSWGTEWNKTAAEENGDMSGYFWISYEDATLTREDAKATALEVEPVGAKDNIYQYDGTVGTKYNIIESGGSVANVFTANANPDGAEKLCAVGLALTDVNVDYSIQIYGDIKDSRNPTSGTALLNQRVTGKTTYAGYHTIDLPSPVYLTEEQTFAVVATLSHKDGTPVKYKVDATYEVENAYQYTNQVASGQSFEKDSAKADWDDLSSDSCDVDDQPRCSARLKVFTNNVDAEPITSTTALTADMITVVNATYTGAALKPAVTVKAKGVTLVSDTDYTLTYKNNINAGTGTVTVTGKGSYTGIVSKTFKINPASIAKAKVSGVTDRLYTGKAQTQSPVVKLGSVVLKSGTDYTLSYKNNTKVGTANLTVTGKGNYTGTVTKTFKITKKSGWKRLAGASGTGAFGTMEQITKEFGEADTAIVVTNADFKDALAAAALAGSYEAPILTTAKGSLSAKTQSELKRMGVKKVIIVGNTSDVSANTEKQIKTMISDTTRITGSGAAGKSVNAATAIPAGRSNTVIIATQKSFKDAMSISSYAYASVTPIIYVESNLKLSDASLNYIKSAGFNQAVIVGGPLAIPTSVDTQLKGAGIAAGKVTRLAGKGCYGTSGAIAEWAMGKLKNGTSYAKGKAYQYTSVKFQPAVVMSANKVGISRGDGWKDALCGAALSGKNRAVILLADGTNSNYAQDVIKKYKNTIAMGYVYGGTQAVPKAVMTKLEKASK